MWPLGGSLFHPGEIPQPGCHLPIAHREQDVSSQFVERRGSTPQLEWGPIEVGQSRSQSHAPTSLASRAIRRVGKFRCPSNLKAENWDNGTFPLSELPGMPAKLGRDFENGLGPIQSAPIPTVELSHSVRQIGN